MPERAAQVTEQVLGDIPWLIVTGERTRAFRLLGEHQARRIRSLATDSEAIRGLRAETAVGIARARLTAAADRSRAAYPASWAELAAMARGARVALDDLVLLNLRGDIGAEEISGCTDIALWTGGHAHIAHNEDGSPELVELCVLLTLALDDAPSTTVWWYPGFLPSNTFGVNEHGLAWAIDNIRIRNPGPGPGRHFVARELHRCRSIAEFASHLLSCPSAGGFTYNVAKVGSGDAAQIETGAGNFAQVVTGSGEPEIVWHTNHLRYLPSALDMPLENSFARGRIANTWSLPSGDATEWCLDVLARTGDPTGVRRDAAGTDPLVTLVTFVVDLFTGDVTVAPRHGPATTIPLSELARGARRRRRCRQPPPVHTRVS